MCRPSQETIILPLLWLLLRNVVASDSLIDGRIFERALEDLASKSLRMYEIQVCKDYF